MSTHVRSSICIHPLTVRLTSNLLWEIEHTLFCLLHAKMSLHWSVIHYQKTFEWLLILGVAQKPADNSHAISL